MCPQQKCYVRNGRVGDCSRHFSYAGATLGYTQGTHIQDQYLVEDESFHVPHLLDLEVIQVFDAIYIITF